MPGSPEFSRQAENPYFCMKFSDFYMFASDFKSVDTTGFKQYTSNIYLVGLQTANLQWLDTSSDKVMTFQLLFWILVTCMSACVCVCVCLHSWNGNWFTQYTFWGQSFSEKFVTEFGYFWIRAHWGCLRPTLSAGNLIGPTSISEAVAMVNCVPDVSNKEWKFSPP